MKVEVLLKEISLKKHNFSSLDFVFNINVLTSELNTFKAH